MLRGVQQSLVRRMSTALLDSFKLTAGQTITCKAAVAWEPKKPLDVTDIQVFSRQISLPINVINFYSDRQVPFPLYYCCGSSLWVMQDPVCSFPRIRIGQFPVEKNSLH